VDPRHLDALEFDRVLDRLAAHASFAAGEEMALALRPATDLREVRALLETTGEARALLLARPGTTIGGARDVRPQVETALRGAALPPAELLDVRDTLVAARTLHRTLTRLAGQFPHLASVAGRLCLCPEIVEEIDRCLDERGEVRDDASPELARIRREVRIANDRIQEKLNRIISSPRNAPYLQEMLITQREGRYVIPLKADFKGRIRGVVHDVSASGATIFIEPLSVVDLNNAWRELQLAETQEVTRILAVLSGLIAEHGEEITQSVETLAELDLVFAKAGYADAIEASAPEIVSTRGKRPTIHLLGARHPLLDPGTVVPIDVVLDEETHVLVITGPNTGGKTVSLKTVGLLVLMAQAGLHLPVEPGSSLSCFETVYADIGDEQSIEQSLSTFSAHLTNILSFLDLVDERSLVLLDELGAGTDPAEGAALARALLDHFGGRGAVTLVATHYPELKTYAQLTPGVRNACVEFDPETLAPTYKLMIGLPGRSNAFAIAGRLGLSREIVEAARRMVSSEDLHTDDMLTDIHRLRVQEAQSRDAANAARAEAEGLARELRERLDGIKEERRDILDRAQEEAAAELEVLRKEARALRQRLQAQGAVGPLKEVSVVAAQADALAEGLAERLPEPEELAPVPIPDASARPIRPGDAVWVRPLRTKGQVIEIDGDEVEVQVGPARTRVGRVDLELAAAAPVVERAPEATLHAEPAASPGKEIDLRGCTVDDALMQVGRHLDAAFRAGLPWVRIIHGKGTGALRRAVRESLSDHPLVSSFAPGGQAQGGEGVTVVDLVQVR
jgi:DNA mismatch repair protein MutS2